MLVWRRPSGANRATGEFVFNPSRPSHGVYTCDRRKVSTPWSCNKLGPGNVGSMLLGDDDEPWLLAGSLSVLGGGGYAVRYPVFKLVKGRRLTCFVSVPRQRRACFRTVLSVTSRRRFRWTWRGQERRRCCLTLRGYRPARSCCLPKRLPNNDVGRSTMTNRYPGTAFVIRALAARPGSTAPPLANSL